MDKDEIIKMLQQQIDSLTGQRNHFASEAGKKVVHHWRCGRCAFQIYCKTSLCPGFVSLQSFNEIYKVSLDNEKFL